jgi:hypothetical protein
VKQGSLRRVFFFFLIRAPVKCASLFSCENLTGQLTDQEKPRALGAKVMVAKKMRKKLWKIEKRTT